MDQNTRGFGQMGKRMVRGDLYWQMEMCIQGIGGMIRLMEMGLIRIQMGLNTAGIG